MTENVDRRRFVAMTGLLAASLGARAVVAEENEIIARVPLVASPASSFVPLSIHPIDRALNMARDGLAQSRANINDYTALLVKRDFVRGKLTARSFIHTKIRNRKVVDGKVIQPLSVYLKFLKPSSVKGREVIYVEGRNDGNMIAHEGGSKGRYLPTVNVPPDGRIAMRGQRYPMTEIGVENLIIKLLERGHEARKFSDAQCDCRTNARFRDRNCTAFHLTLPTKHPKLMFHQAQIFIDDQLNMPIRFIAYDWPQSEGAKLQLLEEYNYLNLKLNVGLTDNDFDPDNSAYNF